MLRIPIEDDEGRTLAFLEGSREEIEAELEEILEAGRRYKDPVFRDRVERRVLRAFSYLNREPGAEHETRTGRRKAGGGKLTKGS